MFGRQTKAQLKIELNTTAAELERVRSELSTLQAMHTSLIAEKAFWQDQVQQYGNQIEFWMNKNREILKQVGKEAGAVDIRAYAQSIAQAIEEHKPKPAELAAALAMGGKSTQGVFTRTLTPPVDEEMEVDRVRQRMALRYGGNQ